MAEALDPEWAERVRDDAVEGEGERRRERRLYVCWGGVWNSSSDEDEEREGEGEGAVARRERWECACLARARPRDGRTGRPSSSSLSVPGSLLRSQSSWSSPVGLKSTALQLGHVFEAALPERSHWNRHERPNTHWH
jgi:hypothetical protein